MNDDTRRYRFGPWEFDPRTGELNREGAAVRLAPQPALVLSILVERAGTLVTRESLQELVWPDTVVEFDKGLNFCIREVRAALGDEAASPTYVETLPRRGYRFIADVERTGPVSPRGRRIAALAGSASGRVAAAGLLLSGIVAFVFASSGGETAPEIDPRAREAAEMGGYLLQRARGDDVERSVEFFRRAVALDPTYARAHAGLGSAYLRLEREEEGKRAIRKSLELDPERWSSHLSLALHAFYREYDRAAAEPHFRRALELAPDEVIVRHTYAWFRAATADLDDAIHHMGAALELDPVSPRVNGDVGRLFYLAGRHDEAIAHCRRTQEIDAETLRHRDCVVHALAEKGAHAAARDEALATMRATGAPAAALAPVGAGAPAEGLDAYWRWSAGAIARLADEGEDSHVHAAAAWARAGKVDRAFAALERAYAVRCPILTQVALDPALRLLADDPRFGEILTRIGHLPAGGSA